MRFSTSPIWLSLLFFVVPSVWADDSGIVPPAFNNVQEEDASPSCFGSIIKVSNTTLTDNADGTCSVTTGGGDSVLVDGTAITDASGVDFIQGTTGIDITLNTGVSPDTATFSFDATEISSLTWGAGAFTTMTFDAGVTDPVFTAASGELALTTGNLAVDNASSLILYEGNAGGTNFKAFASPATITANTTCTFEDDANFIPDSCVGDGTDAGGTDTNADKEFVWPMSALLPLEAADSIPPLAKDAGTNVDMLPVDFDQSTDECRTATFLVPPDITSGGTVTFTVVWYSASVTTNNVIWDFRHNSGVAEGVDPDATLTTVAAAADAVAGTAGQITVTTWTETQTNLAWAASDSVVGVVCRDANNESDNFAADARAILFGIRIPRS